MVLVACSCPASARSGIALQALQPYFDVENVVSYFPEIIRH